MTDRINRFLRRWFSVFLWMLFIFILSSVPGRNIPALPIPFFHKVVHFFEYSVLGTLWIKALAEGRSGTKLFKLSILAWELVTIFALTDEWHQTFVPGRSGKLEDVYFDVICALVGILLCGLIRNKFELKNPRKDNAHA